MKLTKADVGCFADGAFGHDHIRASLRALMLNLTHHYGVGASQRAEAAIIAGELRAAMSDDASEEDDAIELATTCLCDGVHFEMVDGDLMVVSDDSEED